MILGVLWTTFKEGVKNLLKKVQILLSFPHFCRFFNSSWVLAQNNAKFIFIEVFCFIWHPTHPWIWLNSVWKEFKTFLAVCFVYTGAKKDWHPYLINTIEMRSLWMEIKYIESTARLLDRDWVNKGGLDLSKEVLWVSVGQRAADLWAVKVGGQQKIVQESSSTFDVFYLNSKWPHFNSIY